MLPGDGSGTESPRLWRRGGRWWLITGLTFAAINFLFSPVTISVLWSAIPGIVLGAAVPPLLWFIGAVGTIVVPGFLSAGLATLAERALTHRGRPDCSQKWSWRTVMTALGFIAPFIFIPIMFVHSLDLPTDKEYSGMQERARRPIVESDSVGFCSTPLWSVINGQLEMTVAVRVREKGSYRLMMQGSFDRRTLASGAWTTQGLMGVTVRELVPGVDTVRVRTEGDPITVWPAWITHIDLSRTDGELSIDSRSGDSLYVLDESGLRPK